MNKTLEKITDSTLILLEALTPEETYERVIHEAINLVKADYGSIFLIEDNGELKKVYSSDAQIFAIKTRSRGYIYEAFKSNKSFVVDATQIGKVHPTISELGIKSNIYISLSYQKQKIGIICVHSKKKAFFTTEELKVLQLYGALASLAIRKAQAYNEARNALELRDQFISLASHELRTPLTTINGYAQLLYSKLANKNNSESRWIEQLSFELTRLTKMVKEFLDVNHIKVGRIDYYLKECNLLEVISRAIKSVNFTYPERAIVLDDQLKENDNKIIADYDKLIQVFVNVLDNAAKFSPVDSEIKLSIYSEGENFVIDITDQGKGVSEKDMPHIFEGFYKGEDNQKEGMGIGLLLCKHIISYHHGSIELFSVKERGSMVRIRLPKTEI
jgi:K+-sensing histidine kinase KdpD